MDFSSLSVWESLCIEFRQILYNSSKGNDRIGYFHIVKFMPGCGGDRSPESRNEIPLDCNQNPWIEVLSLAAPNENKLGPVITIIDCQILSLCPFI